MKGISGKKVNENKEKFILGLIWTLIVHYSIDKSICFNNDYNKINDKTKFSSKSNVLHSTSEKYHKQALIQWAIDRIEYYPLCALLDSFFPEKINFYSLDPSDTEKNVNIAIQTMNDLKIPALFDLNDLQSTKIDDKALLTQLSVIKMSIEPIRPSQATISKSRTLILDDDFIAHKEEGNNKRYSGRKFRMIMTLKETDYNHRAPIDPMKEQVMFGDIQLALTLTNEHIPYLNQSERKLDMKELNIKNDEHQQFIFGEEEWNTVIDSQFQQGMEWDVADEFKSNPTSFNANHYHKYQSHHLLLQLVMILLPDVNH